MISVSQGLLLRRTRAWRGDEGKKEVQKEEVRLQRDGENQTDEGDEGNGKGESRNVRIGRCGYGVGGGGAAVGLRRGRGMIERRGGVADRGGRPRG